MPCQDCGPSISQSHLCDETKIKKLTDRVDELTQNLCFVCGNLEYHGELEWITNERIMKWWEAHKAGDAKRVKSELRKHIKHNYAPGEYPMESELISHFIKKATDVHPVSDYHTCEWFPNIVIETIEEFRSNYIKTKEFDEIKNAALSKLSKAEKRILGL